MISSWFLPYVDDTVHWDHVPETASQPRGEIVSFSLELQPPGLRDARDRIEIIDIAIVWVYQNSLIQNLLFPTARSSNKAQILKIVLWNASKLYR